MRVFAPSGELVWEATEDNWLQRRLKARDNEVLWRGVNWTETNDLKAPLVGSGVYVYTIHSRDGELLVKGKVAVVR